LTPLGVAKFKESNRLCCGKTNRKLGQEVAMPLLTADPVTVLPGQREALEQLVRTHSTPQQVALRARIILHAVEGMGVRESARELGVWPKTARYWRKRWRDADDKCAVCERLADAPRSGAPATYTPEQICAVVAMTCEKPSESERPISQWTQREIADEAIRRGLVPNISQRSVGRFLNRRFQRHHWRGRRRRWQYQDGKGFHAVSPPPAQQRRSHHKLGHCLRQSQHPPF
jgi:transposase